jgi:hypothetical protein
MGRVIAELPRCAPCRSSLKRPTTCFPSYQRSCQKAEHGRPVRCPRTPVSGAADWPVKDTLNRRNHLNRDRRRRDSYLRPKAILLVEESRLRQIRSV